MDQYLIQILKETNTIIIPDLGALTITNEERNEVMLMPFLKHDDGKLSGHIATKEGIDENEAKNIIAKHVREIKAKLDQGDTYIIFELGTFSKGKDGEVEFSSWDKSKKKVEQTTKTLKIEDKKTLPSIKKEAADKEAPKVASTVNVKSSHSTAVPEKKMNVAEKEEMSKSLDKLNDLKNQKNEREKKKKRGFGFYIILLLILFILIGGTYTFINYDAIKHQISFFSNQEKKSNTPDELNETHSVAEKKIERSGDVTVDTTELKDHKTIAEDDSELPSEESVETPTSEPQPYHIIAGAFGSESNALRLSEKIKAMGYPSTTFQRGKMTMVRIQSFKTNAEALSALNSIKEEIPSAWILKWIAD